MKLWRTLIVLVAAIVASVVVLAVGSMNTPEYASEKTFDVGRADVQVRVLPDARLSVTENLRFRFSDDDFSGAYRDIALHPGTTLSRFSVSDGGLPYEPGASTQLGSAGSPGTFGTTQLAGGAERLVWHYHHAGGGHEDFRIGYVVTGASDAYDDVVLVRWAIWGDQWQFPLDRLLGSIGFARPAGGNAKPIKAWLTPARLQTVPSVTSSGAHASVDRAPEGHQVELAVLYPRSAFASVAGATVHTGSGRAAVIAKEDAATHSAPGAFSNWLWKASGALAGLAALLGFLGMIVLLRRGREQKSTAPKHLPEPPEDLSPAVAYGLATEGDYDNRVVLATLLDLVDRGYYEQSAGAAEGKAGKNGQLDLVLGKGDREQSKLSGLLPHERAVLDFFDELIGDEPGALGGLSKRIPKHSAGWRNRWVEMNAELKKAVASELHWSRDLGPARLIAIVVLAGGMAAVAAGAYPRADEWALPVIGAIWAAAFLLIPSVNALRRLTPDTRERQTRWASFARWTKDFPRLSDDPPATLLLWKRILVYGVAFGTAQRVIESGRIPRSVMDAAGGDTWWGGSPGYGGSPGLYAFMGASDFGHSFSSGFSSQVAAQSSSGGGGGGGGGGASGGGGGGAW